MIIPTISNTPIGIHMPKIMPKFDEDALDDKAPPFTTTLLAVTLRLPKLPAVAASFILEKAEVAASLPGPPGN